MSKQKPTNKEKEKGGQLVIRIAKTERAAFVALCEALDTTAAREIRRFMREFVAAKAPPATQASGTAEATGQVSEEPAAQTQTAAEDAPTAPVATEAAEAPKKLRKRAQP